MRSKFKIPLLLAILAVGVMGVSAASASAHSFLLTSKAMENIEVKAATSNGQGFEISGAVSTCMKGKFATVAATLAPAETLLVHPTYSECEVELGGTHNATVTTTGCNYIFHAAAPSTTNGTVDVECESGKLIKVTVEGLGCEILIPGKGTKAPEEPNQGLKTVEYVNLAGGKVEVRAKVEAIKYRTTCGGIPAEGSTGKYQEGVLPPALGTGPAIAVAEAFNTSKVFEEAMVE